MKYTESNVTLQIQLIWAPFNISTYYKYNRTQSNVATPQNYDAQ